MPLALAAACSAHPVDKAQGTKPTAQTASLLCHPLGTSRLDKHAGRAPDFHRSLLTPHPPPTPPQSRPIVAVSMAPLALPLVRSPWHFIEHRMCA
jgi:hypothetical protein